MKSKKTFASTVAVEEFMPDLSSTYMELFKKLIEKLGNSLSINRNHIIQEEIEKININTSQNEDIELLKYLACLNVLKDLSLQGWCFDINGESLRLKMEDEDLDDKAHIRYRLSAERNAQFKVESIKTFIKKMETPRRFNN